MDTNTEACLQMLHSLIDSKAEGTVGPHQGDPGCPTVGYDIKYAQFDKDLTDKIIKGIEQLQSITDTVLPIDFSITLSVLYDAKIGILNFLSKIFLCKELESVVKKCLEFVNSFLIKLQPDILLRQIADTRNLMLEMAICIDTTSKEKELALDNLIFIINMKRVMPTNEVERTLNALYRFVTTHKHPPLLTFRRVFEVVGLICRIYKKEAGDAVHKIEEMLLKCLESQSLLEPSCVKSPIVEGCITGIGHIMMEHSFISEEKTKSRNSIYKVLKYFLDKKFASENSGPKGPQLAGLTLLAQSGFQLSPLIYEDYLFWHETFLYWVSRDNSKLHQIGYQGLSSFYFIIGQYMKGRCAPQDTTVFKYFMDYFKATVMSLEGKHPMYEISLSIQGYGDFSGPCATMMPPIEVNSMFATILQRAEEFLKCTRVEDNSLVYLPKYAQALGMIVGCITTLGPQYQATLQCLSVLLFERFPTLPVFTHKGCVEALLVIFDNLLRKKGSIAEQFINEIVYQSMIRTCSNTILLDADIIKETISAHGAYMLITYDRYLPVWEGLLNMNPQDNYKSVNHESCDLISEKVLGAFIKAVINLINKLDLGTKEKINNSTSVESEETGPDTMIELSGMDPETSLEACKPKDFRVFINMVDLCHDILPRAKVGSFLKWVDELMETLIVYAIQQPLISGFKKLITLCLKICNSASYYKDIGAFDDGRQIRKVQCYQLICRFLRDVVTGMSQFKGDLLLSSLRLLMMAPVKMVPNMLQLLVTPFKMALKLGLSYLSIASELVSTLSSWHNELPRNTLEPLLFEIVPLLDGFLHSKDHTDSSDAPVELVELQMRRSTKVRVPRRNNMAQAGEKDSALASLQRQILMFIAQLDSPTCLSVIRVEDSQMAEEAISWTTKRLLKLDLPFSELKPSIYLDDFLPRVCKLALTSGDRHTRITACELLHSSVIFILGTSVQVNVASAEYSELPKLMNHITPTIFALGCDSDVLVRQLFHPLVLQVIHYQTNQRNIESKETSILMNTIMDGLTHSENVALRDFSAICLKEFVIWMFKQSSKSETFKISFNSIMKKVIVFSKHPCQFKRLGSALAINSLYAIIREQKSMDDCWLELLYYMVNSLLLTSSTDELVGTQQQTMKALTHIERVLREKSSVYNKSSRTRSVPPEFGGNCLKDAILWLMKKCSSKVEACRRVCQTLVLNLAKWSVDGAISSAQALAVNLQNCEPDIFVEICEVTEEHSLTVIQLNNGADLPVQWINILHGSLDCYKWLIQNRLTPFQSLFHERCSPKIFKAAALFCQQTISKINEMETDDVSLLTIREAEELESLKCTVITSILNFLNIVLETKSEDSNSILLQPRLYKIVEPVLTEDLWRIVSLLVFEPQTLGFTMKNKLLLQGMLPVLRNFLVLFPLNLRRHDARKLITALNDYLVQHNDPLEYLDGIKPASFENGVKPGSLAFVQGCILLLETDIWSQLETKFLLTENTGELLMAKVFCCLNRKEDENYFVVPISADVNLYLSSVLKLAFRLKVPKTILYQKILDDTLAEDTTNRIITSIGVVIRNQMIHVINEFLLEEPIDSMSKLLNSDATTSEGENVNINLGDKFEILNFTRFLLADVFKSSALKARYGNELSEMIMEFFPTILTYENQMFLEVTEILAYLAYMLKRDSEQCKYIVEWVSAKFKASDLDLGKKRRCLDLAVPIFEWHLDHQIELMSALETMKKENFPILTSHLMPGSAAMISYKAMFSRLLVVLEHTKNEKLLYYIASVSACDTNHVSKEEILDCLKRYTKSVSAEKQEEIILALFNSFERQIEVAEKVGYIDQYLVPFLHSCDRMVLINFFAAKIQNIYNILKSKFDSVTSMLTFKRQIVSKSGCFKLVEVMYGYLSHSDFQIDSPIGQAFAQSNSNESLNKILTKAAFSPRNENITIRDEDAELYRNYQSDAFNVLVAIICCLYPDVAPNEVAKYSELIFRHEKKAFHWAKIIDCSQKISLKMDFDHIPKKKGVLVSIRKDARDHRGTIRKALRSGSVTQRSQTVQYVVSQQLFDSSLSEDVTKFDLSNVDVVSFGTQSQQSLDIFEEEEIQEEVFLELDAINKHKCMPILCAVARKLGAKIKPISSELPQWMKNLIDTLKDTYTHANIKLFIIKLIINTEDVFRPYASHWIEQICATINDKSLGATVNYMITDTVSMLLSWHNVAIPNPNQELQKMEASNLLLTMMKMSHHPRRDIMKFVLELVKTMVEVWKPALSVNYQIFFNMICKPVESKVVHTGLQLTAILLVNKLLPWNSSSATEFVDSLLVKHLASSEKKIYHLAAENTGIILKWAFGKEQDLGEIASLDRDAFLTTTIRNLNVVKEQLSIFYEILHTIHRHYPPIVDTFMNRILFNYPKQIANYKTQSLDMICSRLEVIEDKWCETSALGIERLLTTKDPVEQTLALRIVAKMLPELTPEQALTFLSKIPTILQDSAPETRGKVYELLEMAFMQFRSQEGEISSNLTNLAISGLLGGLSDQDETLQKKVLDFLQKNAINKAKSLPERFVDLIKILFVNESANLFVGSYMELLLEELSSSPDYKRNIFEHNLGDCNYENMQLLLSWRTQHATMQPLFVETQASQAVSQSFSSSGSLGAGNLRATQQSLLFEPTLEEDQGEVETKGPQFAISQSSLLFNLLPSSQLRTSNSNNSAQLQEGETQPQFQFRFVANEKQKRVFFAKKQLVLKSRRSEVSRDHQRKREGQVRMYRKYRIGDFPDIQIPFSAILKPLQILAKREPALSKSLWVAMFSSFCDALKTSEEQLCQFLKDMESGLKTIIETTTGCVPMVIGAVLEIAFRMETELNSAFMSEVCSLNSLAPLGCLLLEKYIEDPISDSSGAKKPRLDMLQTSNNKKKWLKLAELYQQLEDRDSVLAIIKRALHDPESEITKAVEAETSGKWLQAKNYYNSFLENVDVFEYPPEYEFCIESYFKCVEKLSRWEDVGKKVLEVANIDEVEGEEVQKLWSESWNQERLLPWFLKSQIFDILESGTEPTYLVNLLTSWLKNPDYLSIFKNRFSEEVALIYLMNDDAEKSRFYSRLNLQILLEQWSVLSTFLPRSRAKKLGRLQCVAEMINFTEVSVQEEFEKYQVVLEKLCSRWNEDEPTQVDSLLMWETRVEYRSFFAKNALALLNQTDCENATLFQLLRQMKSKQELALIDLAVHQNNLAVATKFIRNTEKIRNDRDLGVRWNVALGKIKWLTAQTKEDPNMRLRDTTIAFKDIYKVLSTNAQPNQLNVQQRASVEGELAEISWALASFLRQNNSYHTSKEVKDLLGFINVDEEVIQNKEVFFEQFGRDKSKAALEMLLTRNIDLCLVEGAHMRIVHHCRELLKNKAISEDEECSLSRALIESLLDAMKIGSKEARMLFPCLLQMDEISKEFLELFVKKCKEVPEWMYLGWLNQILAFIDTEKVPAIEDILIRVANTYSNALILPFHFAKERISNTTSQLRGTTKALVKRLDTILSEEKLALKIIKALCDIKQPELSLRPYLVELFNAVCENRNLDLNPIFKRMCLELYQSETICPGEEGAYQKVRKYCADIESVLEPLIQNSSSRNSHKDKAKEMIRAISANLSATISNLRSTDSRTRLADFSVWLAEFQACKFNTEVEIPGQYTGDKVPNPKYHVKFSTFESSVEVLRSIRQPIKFTCVGNNGQNYSYIMKAGEDLRQDERIQLLFDIMNKVLANDQFCRERQLRIKTYRVIPITSRCGIIQFVPNCAPLREFTDSALTPSETDAMKRVRASYEEEQKKASGSSKLNEVFGHIFTSWSENKTTQMFDNCIANLPKGPLKRSFIQLSSSNEGFFWLRQNFVSGLATLSITHWLLGIGDRHRSNMLICQKTGVPVGIDFGHAFGSATQFLGVPEMMPFRLTNHLVEMMGPLGTSGTLRATMIHTLQALRKDHELLLNAMRVFIQEPSLDWKENAKKLNDNQLKYKRDFNLDDLQASEEAEEDFTIAFAEQKIELATNKLQGCLPALVTEEELRTSTLSGTTKKAVFKIVRGNHKSLREQLRKEAEQIMKTTSSLELMKHQISSEQQVDCLIEQATDKHILGKTFWGWEAWC